MLVTFLIVSMGINMKVNCRKTNPIYESWHELYVVKYCDGAYVNSGTLDQKKIAISESQGYGMLITVLAASKQEANQKEFDALLDYYKQHTISDINHLMAWKQVYTSGEMLTDTANNTNATDGDLDIAYALLKADKLWGSQGNHNYRGIANDLMRDLLNYNYSVHNQLLYLGCWAKNDKRYQSLVRTSDLIPAYFKIFFEESHDERWQFLYNQSIDTLELLSDRSVAGLFPDFFWIKDGQIINAKSDTLESDNDGDYGWNANRIPFRLAYNTNNNELMKLNNKLLRFFEQKNRLTAGYDLSGRPLNDYTSMAFTAPIAVAVNQQKNGFNTFAEKIVQQVKTTPLTGNYYADTLQMLAILIFDNAQ